MSSAFHIKNLVCAYDKDPSHAVLQIDDLTIPRGELVFLLGSSGSGKSTLLEILGLMNNTIAAGTITFYQNDGTPVDLAALWENDNQAAAIRKSNFSFIFQNTNLMENFTAYENISLSKMIQQNVPQQAAMDRARVLMNQVGLPENQVSTTALSVNLSGGQRQRVAFVRALNSDCNILFGDEPTGNLDEGNANELMKVIKNYLTQNITAIIVSHDINLAINHASRIVCLTRNPDTGIGEILPQNIFKRSDWVGMDSDSLMAFRAKIKGFYTAPADKIKEPESPASKPNAAHLSSSYRQLFLSKEGKALAGKNWSSLIVLSILLFFTFLAIGFANGSLAYINEKMNDPFVNWLTVEIPWAKAGKDDLKTFQQTLNDPVIKTEYAINSVNSFSEMPLVFWSPKESKYFSVQARSIELNKNYADPVLKDIIKPENTIQGTIFRDEKDLSIIVTERFLRDYGYPPDAHHVDMETVIYDSTCDKCTARMPIGIRAVVKDMPGKAQVAYSLFFCKAFNQVQGCTFNPRIKKEIILYTNGDKQATFELKKSINKYIPLNPHAGTTNIEAEAAELNHDTYLTANEIHITFSPLPTYQLLDSFYQEMMADKTLAPLLKGVTRIYDYYDFTPADPSIPIDKLSVNFDKLDKVRAFATYFLHTFNTTEDMKRGGSIEIDLTKVKEKENFNFLSHTAFIISFILIIFGSTAVGLFLFNLLKMHLLKVKMNIGTFKAFGLSNVEAQGIYFVIVARFLMLSILLSLLLACLVGISLDKLISSIFIVETGVSFFKLMDKFTLVTLVLILSSALAVSWFTIRNILSKSPGDLIYNR